MSSGTVLVTGASTGIGEATARHLKGLGFDVLAGVRKDEDAERLAAAGLGTLKLDVTDSGSIEALRSRFADAPLAGLVNNAGVAVAGPLEFIPIEDLRRQLEVNLIGQMAVTQAVLPALRRARGRIVNISSIGGRLALPMVGPYAASKFGLEGLSDTLRRELARFGVDVILIEPGGVKTPIWAKSTDAADQMAEGMPPEAEQLYGPLMDRIRVESKKISERTGIDPSEVAETIGTALTTEKPKTRYLVGKDAKGRWAVAKRVPDRVMDRLIARQMG
ncbi:MAG: SDR family oxidoreductase [Thermoleophilaceae bacterium]|nr:SDR family oxidoreductase [Thermoleophilaceae bacterium]